MNSWRTIFSFSGNNSFLSLGSAHVGSLWVAPERHCSGGCVSPKILKAPWASGQRRTHTDANGACGLENPKLDGWSRDIVTLLKNQIVCVIFFPSKWNRSMWCFFTNDATLFKSSIKSYVKKTFSSNHWRYAEVGLLVNTTLSSELNVGGDWALIHLRLFLLFRFLLSQQALSSSFKLDYTSINPGKTFKTHIRWWFICFTS